LAPPPRCVDTTSAAASLATRARPPGITRTPSGVTTAYTRIVSARAAELGSRRGLPHRRLRQPHVLLRDVGIGTVAQALDQQSRALPSKSRPNMGSKRWFG
jgi:hypothetical protein